MAAMSDKFTPPGRRAYPLANPQKQRQMLGKLKDHGTPESRKKFRDALASRYPGIKEREARDG
jgi:hypothetical protein